MTLIPCPTPLAGALRDEESVEVERNLYCRNYDACLHLAVKKGWEGWSCAQCPLFSHRGEEPEARDFAHSRPRSLITPD